MANKAGTIKVLMLHESQDEAEQLFNLIRNSGFAARGQLFSSKQELEHALTTDVWDLLLLRPEVGEVMALDCLKLVRRLAKDIPAIVLINELSSEVIVQALRDGFEDAVAVTEPARLGLVIKREMANLSERRARRNVELVLKDTEKRCTMLLDSSRDAIVYVVDGMLIYVNDAFAELFGYDDADDLDGMPIMDMISVQHQDNFKQFLRDFSTADAHDSELLSEGVGLTGDPIQLRMQLSRAVYDGESCIQILIRSNVANAELEERLKEISSQDLLTGLFNRTYFNQRLEECIHWSVQQRGSSVLLYVQLDNFEAIQSEAGISGADIVLTDFATKIREQLSEEMLVARFGDDIFTILYQGQSLAAGEALAKDLCAVIADHLCEVQGRTYQLTASIGVTAISEAYHVAEQIINSAHYASEQVRAANPLGNGVSVFVPITQPDEANADDELEKAFESGRFKLLFQPIIDLRGGSSELYEAFLRLLDENGNEVKESPEEFLQRISEADLRGRVDRWVIGRAIKMLAQHRAAGNNTRLFVNITGESLTDQTLLPWLSSTMHDSRLPTDAVIFQFNESDATTYLKQAKDFTRGLKELRCKVSMSHFGCALNPFSNLKHLEVDYLKIDGSFMRDIQNEKSRQNLQELVATAHSQGKLTIAPMVESAGILSVLWQVGVNFIQGYYLQVPTDHMDYDFSNEG